MAPLFQIDIAGAAFAVVAGFASILAAMSAGGAPARARSYLRLCAILGTALAAGDLIAALVGSSEAALLAGAITLLVAALGPALLALAGLAQCRGPVRPGLAAAALVLASLLGFGAAATGSALFAFAPLVLSVMVLAALGLRLWPQAHKTAALMSFAAFAFIAGSAAFMAGGGAGTTGFALFFAAGLMGGTLALVRRPELRSDLALEAAAERPTRGPFFIGGGR